MKLRLADSTRGASGPTAPPQEGGASEDDTLLRTGRSAIFTQGFSIILLLQLRSSLQLWRSQPAAVAMSVRGAGSIAVVRRL